MGKKSREKMTGMTEEQRIKQAELKPKEFIRKSQAFTLDVMRRLLGRVK